MAALHLRGWLDIARRTVVCALKGHQWHDYPKGHRLSHRHFCVRCGKDEAR
jgi:hypothetical protein